MFHLKKNKKTKVKRKGRCTRQDALSQKSLSLILKQLKFESKAKAPTQRERVGLGVCVFSIFHYHRRHHHHLSLSPSNMGSSNSRLDSRPSRPPRVNGTNRSNLFSLICGGSSSRATHQVHHFQPKKSFLSFTYFYQYPFRFLCLFSINSWILIFKIWLFGVLGFAQSVPKIVPIHHHHRGNLFFLSCKSNTQFMVFDCFHHHQCEFAIENF